MSFVHGRKTGNFASRENLGRDAEQRGQDTGRPGKYGTVGNPTILQCVPKPAGLTLICRTHKHHTRALRNTDVTACGDDPPLNPLKGRGVNWLHLAIPV